MSIRSDTLVPRMMVFSSIQALTDAAVLSEILGHEVRDVRVEPLRGIGYSNSALSRVEADFLDDSHRTFVLKHARLAEDWTARRTGDCRGREALLLNQSSLVGVWDVFVSPYVAAAVASGEAALLMRDLTAALLPDERAPLSEQQESRLLGTLARLHARFWGHDDRSIDWLVRPAQFCDLLGPSVADDPAEVATLSPTLRDGVPRGWGCALARLPPEIARHLRCPGAEWERSWADVPRTLIHGDVKVANFALEEEGVSAFDWAMVGSGPCAIDVGWYLAVNASRLTRSKDDTLRRYRDLLQTALGDRVPDSLWDRLEEIAVVSGARMLLWSKALALDAGRAGASEEWGWWVNRLAAVRSGSPR